MHALADLLRGLQEQAEPLVLEAEEPYAELLALVWGTQFDRLQARRLVKLVAPPAAPGLWNTLQAAADDFDRLPGAGQQRLRRLIVRHQRRWENLRHAPHPAD